MYQKSLNNRKIAVVGTGPSGLMTAFLASQAGWRVDLFEKNSGIGRKILIAGSSGFNIGNSSTVEEFMGVLEHDGNSTHISNHFKQFFTKEWLDFLANLEIETFLGTSKRYFTKEMHAAYFLKQFLKELEKYQVNILVQKNLVKISLSSGQLINLGFEDGLDYGPYEYVSLNLGGGSWQEKPVQWPKVLLDLGLDVITFSPANVGFHVKEWTKSLIEELVQQPIKDCVLTTQRGSKRGDLIITHYGLEGTLTYFVGTSGAVHIDFFPQYGIDILEEKLLAVTKKENLNNLRKIKKLFASHKTLHGLLFHTYKNINDLSISEVAKLLKNFPLTFEDARPLSEAISSKGGISMKECDENLMSIKIPRLFFAGEMLNWSAPTGGYLIQTCVTQGYIVGKTIADRYHN